MTDSPHFKDWDLSHWAYLNGKPEADAVFKALPDDFVVTEQLPFELTGDGENLFILIEKRELNTQQVCQHLAKVLGKRLRDVGYAGLKDKQSVSRQWFSIQANVNSDIDLSQVENDNIKIIETRRHLKKLKVGALAGNHFDIRLKQVGMIDDLLRRLAVVKVHGVPNYFGLQRFGFNGNNLNWANRWSEGEPIRDKKIKGFALSAARSYLFNEVVSARINQQYFSTPISGDTFILAGSNSYFTDEIDATVLKRLSERDIYLSAPMFGKGDNPSQSDAAELEAKVLDEHPLWQQLLIEQGLEFQRRAIQLFPLNMEWKVDGEDVIVSFDLPSGAFATSVLRECVNFRD